MNYLKIQICLYTLIYLNIILNVVHFASATDEGRVIESSYCGELLEIKLDCSYNSKRKRRSLYDAFLTDVSLNKYEPPSEVVNMSNYEESSMLETMEELYSSVAEEKKGETEVTERCPDEQSDSSGTGANEPSSEVHTLTEKCGIDCTMKAEIDIKCNSLELSSNYINPSIRKVDIKSPGTIKITSGWANELTNITNFKIKSDHGLELPRNCSWIPPSTQDLDLTDTFLGPTFALNGCSSPLKRVSLSRTSLKSLSVCQESLEELDASGNSLLDNGLDEHCHHGHQNLKTLKLDNNQISSFSTCRWPSLVHIQLQHNALVSVNLTSCDSRNHLSQIDLSHNKLQMTPESYPPQLTSINLSHNELEKLTPFNEAIQFVSASHNSLVIIGAGTFRDASQLRSLNLSYNQLADIREEDLSGLDSLLELDLSHNAITHIGHNAFRHLRAIRSIRINHNSLQQLDSRLLKTFRGSTVAFTATENPWQCSCHLLATLSSASSAACKPDCPKSPTLTCSEGTAVLPIQDVLERCLTAMQDIEAGTAGVYLLPENAESDDDTSEEQKKEWGAPYYMIIPVVIVIVVVIPLAGFCVRKVYLKRKSIRAWCRSRCLCSNPGPSNGRLSKQDIERDRDLEPGTVLLHNDRPTPLIDM